VKEPVSYLPRNKDHKQESGDDESFRPQILEVLDFKRIANVVIVQKIARGAFELEFNPRSAG
jgi:hypothetical protein